MAEKITWTDKTLNKASDLPITETWRYTDANDVKYVVNTHADEIDSILAGGIVPVAVDGVSITGNGTTGSPLVVTAGSVSSVFGRAGVVIAESGDYTTDQVTEGTTSLYNKVPIGGSTGQVLAKASATDLDLEWITSAGGGGNASAVEISAKVNEAAGVIKGQIVYISGATGGFPTVSLASNDDFSKADVLAIAKETATDNQTITVVTTGLLENIDTSAFAEGVQLYLGVNGALTDTHPTGINAVQRVGHAVKINASTGSIIVEREPLTAINDHNGTMRYQIVNQNAGAFASVGYTLVNDADHRSSINLLGSGWGAGNEILGIYNEGYGRTIFTVDGNHGFEWNTDETDSHNFSSTVKMSLSANGSLTAVAFIGDGSGLTGISADNMATANLLFTTARIHDLAGFGLTFSDGQTTLIGAGTTVATNALLVKNGAGSPLTLLDIKDNGRAGYAGDSFTNVAHIMHNPSGATAAILRLHNSLGNKSHNFGDNGSFELYDTSNRLFLNCYVQSGQSHLQLKFAGANFMDLYTNGSYLNSSLRLGGTTAASNDVQLELTSTTNMPLRLTPMTAAQASGLTPLDGGEVYVSDTDATFTSIGFWGYENGAWIKL